MTLATKQRLRRGPSIDRQRGATDPLRVLFFDNYDWSQLDYPELAPERERIIREKLQALYEARCEILPSMATYLTFEQWYGLYRVYMKIGDAPRRVLRLMVQNLRTEQIAARLGKSESVVTTHVGTLKAAFGANTREFLVFLLLTSGILLPLERDRAA